MESSFNDISYGIVLLTADDVVSTKKDGKIEDHARQNVILEYGLLRGKLGKEKVCLLRKGDVNIPSDLHGIGFIKMDNSGAWKKDLIDEIKASLVF